MTPLAVVRALRAFAAERAPIPVLAVLALGLAAGPWALAGGDIPALARAMAVLFFVLFVLRIVDDIRSIARDRITHPRRGLAAGRIAVRPLVAGAFALSVAAILLAGPRAGLVLIGLALCYAAYFSSEDRVPVVARPPLVNMVFLAMPLLVARCCGSEASAPLALLGVFFWLGAVGHDYAHEVHAAAELRYGATCSAVVGPRTVAILAAACYAGCAAAGLAAARGAGQDARWFFMLGLVPVGAWVMAQLAVLIARPSAVKARRLYVSGFACFVVPSLLLGLEHLLVRP